MSVGKKVIALVAIIMVLGITAATFNVYHPLKVEISSSQEHVSTGIEPKHHSLNLSEDINIKSNQ